MSSTHLSQHLVNRITGGVGIALIAGIALTGCSSAIDPDRAAQGTVENLAAADQYQMVATGHYATTYADLYKMSIAKLSSDAQHKSILGSDTKVGVSVSGKTPKIFTSSPTGHVYEWVSEDNTNGHSRFYGSTSKYEAARSANPELPALIAP
jgi:uncharacterized protein YceK